MAPPSTNKVMSEEYKVEEFYDVHEQSQYKIVVSRPETIEQLSDLFISKDELDALVGGHYYMSEPSKKREFILKASISAELVKWATKLDESGKKTLVITDDALLDVLKDNCYVSDFIDDTYGRHGNRICYARRYKRKKTKPTQTDVRDLWRALSHGFYQKFKTHPTHIPGYDRHLRMFKAFKEIVGWRKVRSWVGDDKERAKFFRLIWDNPEEYIK